MTQSPSTMSTTGTKMSHAHSCSKEASAPEGLRPLWTLYLVTGTLLLSRRGMPLGLASLLSRGASCLNVARPPL